jgi:hypothetical protein
MKEALPCWLRRYVVRTQPHEAESNTSRQTSGQCAGRGAVTCNRLQIAAATDPTHSCRQSEYLGSYGAFTMKSADSVYVVMIFIEIREGRKF